MSASNARSPAEDRAVDALMESFLDGDPRAFEQLYRALSPRVVGFLRSLCNDPALAEDLAQTTFLKVHRARESFHRGSPVVPWVFSIARRSLIDAKRSAAGAMVVLSDDGTLPEPATVDEEDDLRRLSVEQTQALYARLDSLSEVQREAVMLLKVQGLSVREAAAVAGVNASTLKVRAHRAYEALREALGLGDKKGGAA